MGVLFISSGDILLFIISFFLQKACIYTGEKIFEFGK